MLYAIRILKTRQKEERGNFQSDLMELYRRGEWKGGVYEGRWRGGGEAAHVGKKLSSNYLIIRSSVNMKGRVKIVEV